MAGRVDRRSFLVGSGLALGALATGAGLRTPAAWGQAAAGAAPDPEAAAARWAFADGVQAHLDAAWQVQRRLYGSTYVSVNATMLLLHSAAALAGHTGPTRNDERARILIGWLCTGPAWVEKVPARAHGHRHAPGWIDGGFQHPVVDAEIVEALTMAWRARASLGLDTPTALLIADRIARTARGSFWRWPSIALNQINWYVRLGTSAAVVSGDPATFTDILRQIRRFVDRAGIQSARKAGNLGPGYRFHYLPSAPPSRAANVDSPEYACIVLGFLGAYQEARAIGMPPLDPARTAVIRAWAARAFYGYWTHAGYLNWDTGLGFGRWHQGKKVGLAQTALLGLAACDELRPPDLPVGWVCAVLDQGFARYARQIAQDGGLPPANNYGVPTDGNTPQSRLLTAARYQANAALAATAQFPRGEQPPPFYAYDPDTSRLAVSTPTYNTAVVPVSQGAFPYGGLDLARLFDGAQEVAGNVGGRPPSAFGLIVRDPRGRMVTATQHPLEHLPTSPPLRLTAAPAGAGRRLPPYPARPYAGPFTELRAAGGRRSGNLRLGVEHRILPEWIETTWTLARVARTPRRRVGVEVVFPSTGPGAAIGAVLADGRSGVLAKGQVLELAQVAWFSVRSARSGYVVVVTAAPAGARATITQPARQRSQPQPGPTLVLLAATATAAARVGVRARIAPCPDVEDAPAVAARLRAS
jgi:hypothetical protein